MIITRCLLVLSIQMLTMAATLNTLTDGDVKDILATFEGLRRSVGASNMQRLFWNEDLANAAANFAMNCQVRSNPQRASQVPGLDTVGETWSVSGTTPPNYAQLIATWFRQRESYNLKMNSCTSAEMCSFYLQLVWANSTDVGCGAVKCPNIEGFPAPGSTLFICYYGPEMLRGQRPYQTGTHCSGCPHTCSDDLCSTCRSTSVCDQICIRTENSSRVVCDCHENFSLGDDAQGCISTVNPSLLTLSANTLLVEWSYPKWDVNNLTYAYNITCFNRDASVNHVLWSNEATQLSVELQTVDGYECCIAVLTLNGAGPQSCAHNTYFDQLSIILSVAAVLVLAIITIAIVIVLCVHETKQHCKIPPATSASPLPLTLPNFSLKRLSCDYKTLLDVRRLRVGSITSEEAEKSEVSQDKRPSQESCSKDSRPLSAASLGSRPLDEAQDYERQQQKRSCLLVESRPTSGASKGSRVHFADNLTSVSQYSLQHQSSKVEKLSKVNSAPCNLSKEQATNLLSRHNKGSRTQSFKHRSRGRRLSTPCTSLHHLSREQATKLLYNKGSQTQSFKQRSGRSRGRRLSTTSKQRSHFITSWGSCPSVKSHASSRRSRATFSTNSEDPTQSSSAAQSIASWRSDPFIKSRASSRRSRVTFSTSSEDPTQSSAAKSITSWGSDPSIKSLVSGRRSRVMFSTSRLSSSEDPTHSSSAAKSIGSWRSHSSIKSHASSIGSRGTGKRSSKGLRVTFSTSKVSSSEDLQSVTSLGSIKSHASSIGSRSTTGKRSSRGLWVTFSTSKVSLSSEDLDQPQSVTSLRSYSSVKSHVGSRSTTGKRSSRGLRVTFSTSKVLSSEDLDQPQSVTSLRSYSSLKGSRSTTSKRSSAASKRLRVTLSTNKVSSSELNPDNPL